MADQIYIGNFANGLKLNRTAFNINNDAFPILFNFFVWRGRAKKKRGTLKLGRLNRQIQSVANATPPAPFQVGQFDLVGGGGSLFTATITNITFTATTATVTTKGSIFSIGQEVIIANVNPNSGINGISYPITAVTANTFTIFVGSSAGMSYTDGGVANLSSEFPSLVPGSVRLTTNAGANVWTEPSPPDGTLLLNGVSSPGSGIDYSTGNFRLANAASGPAVGTFSYYPGLPVMGLRDFSSSLATRFFPDLVAFDTTYAYEFTEGTGFFSVSYYKASKNPVIWNGEDYQQFWTANYSGAMWAVNNVPGFHFVQATSVAGGVGANITFNFKKNGVNYTTLVVGDVVWFNEFTAGGTNINRISGVVQSGGAGGNYVIHFTQSQTVIAGDSGIAQLLTASIAGQDGIRWYDGDPTGGTGLPTGDGLGWVNFAPPLTALTVQIDNTIPAKYYLVGALAVLPFKDRLLFFSPYIQSSTGAPIQLFDTVIWSWNGTPYYNVDSITTVGGVESYTYSLVPLDQTASPQGWYVDQAGLGGYLSAGISQPIATISNNEDVLLIGFAANGRKTRFVYTGNDLQPFIFFNINSELPSTATFSSVVMDAGMIDIGTYGIAMTDQQTSQRIDLDIPDSVFQIKNADHGAQRVNAIRDFFNEWIYFTYPVSNSPWRFPVQSFFLNYRDNTWAILYENWTAHGRYRARTKRSWNTLPYNSWNEWLQSWDTGVSTAFATQTIAGNPEGYVLIIGQGTNEAPSGYVHDIVDNLGNTQITSYNHCVSSDTLGIGDYLYFTDALGYFKEATITNITLGTQTTVTAVNTFVAGEYILIWGVIGTTQLNGNIYQVVSSSGTDLIIDVNSTKFFSYQSGGEISLAFNHAIGRVIQTIDEDNFVVDIPYPFTPVTNVITAITNAAIATITLTSAITYVVGDEVTITGVLGMTELNGNTYVIRAVGATTIQIDVDTTTYQAYISGGLTTLVQYFGLGQYSKLTLPLIQTKQFPFYWETGRKVRLAAQKYLLDRTENSQVTVNIYLSQDPSDVWNNDITNPPPNELVYTQIMYTCPESSNLGLTPFNANLQMPISQNNQTQIWHRFNTSLIGDSVQIGITLNDRQMKNFVYATDEIALHGIQLTVEKGPLLA